MPNWLKAAFHIIGVAIEATAKAIAIAAKFLAQKAWAALRFVGRHVVDFGKAVGHAFEKLWDTVLRPAIKAIVQGLHDVYVFARDVVNKIITVLRHVYHVLDWIYTHFVRPLLGFIDQIRRVLQLLAKLGVKWAADLDRVLGQIELWIYNAFEAVRSRLNSIINVLNILLDPNMLIRANVFLGTVNNMAGGVLALIIHHGILGSKRPGPVATPDRDERNDKADLGNGVTLHSDEVANGVRVFREMVNYLL